MQKCLDGHIRVSGLLRQRRAQRLRYELFRGRLSDATVQESEANLADFVKARGNTKPHLIGLM